jgi:hypothetical protein
MLHVNYENIIKKNYIWDEIVKNKHKFYSKNLDSFIGYAKRQADKYGIKSSRMDTIEKLINIFNKFDSTKKLSYYLNEIPQFEHTQIVNESNDTFKHLRMLKICDKFFQETVTIEYVKLWLIKFFNTYGERVKLAKENKNIDFKSLSHAVRAALQLIEIYTTNDLKYPLKDKQLLMDIKNGKLDFVTEISPLITSLMNEVKFLSKNSDLPEMVDYKFWNNFIFDILKEEFLL